MVVPAKFLLLLLSSLVFVSDGNAILTTMEVVLIPGHFMAVIVFVHAASTTGNIQTSASIGLHSVQVIPPGAHPRYWSLDQ